MYEYIPLLTISIKVLFIRIASCSRECIILFVEYKVYSNLLPSNIYVRPFFSFGLLGQKMCNQHLVKSIVKEVLHAKHIYGAITEELRPSTWCINPCYGFFPSTGCHRLILKKGHYSVFFIQKVIKVPVKCRC